MERKPPPPPMASWPLPPLTSPHYGMVKGRSVKNGASKYPRSNKEVCISLHLLNFYYKLSTT